MPAESFELVFAFREGHDGAQLVLGVNLLSILCHAAPACLVAQWLLPAIAPIAADGAILSHASRHGPIQARYEPTVRWREEGKWWVVGGQWEVEELSVDSRSENSEKEQACRVGRWSGF